jgi:hypothetical protein
MGRMMNPIRLRVLSHSSCAELSAISSPMVISAFPVRGSSVIVPKLFLSWLHRQ